MKDGKSLESYVQYVYNMLLNLRGEGVLVTMRPRLPDRALGRSCLSGTRCQGSWETASRKALREAFGP